MYKSSAHTANIFQIFDIHISLSKHMVSFQISTSSIVMGRYDLSDRLIISQGFPMCFP